MSGSKKFRGFEIIEDGKYYQVYRPDGRWFGRFERYTHLFSAIIAAWTREHGVRD